MAEKKPANRDKTGKFQKGQSGNPTGRPKMDPEAMALFRDNTLAAAQRIVRGIDSDNEKIAIMCSQYVVDRVYGKPVQASDVQMDVSGALDVRAQIHAALLEQAKQAKEHAE